MPLGQRWTIRVVAHCSLTVVEVIAGRVSIECSEETVECEAGTLVTFDPGEHHTVRALVDARLLLLLAPWPAEQHNTEPEKGHGQLRGRADPVARRDRRPAGITEIEKT